MTRERAKEKGKAEMAQRLAVVVMVRVVAPLDLLHPRQLPMNPRIGMRARIKQTFPAADLVVITIPERTRVRTVVDIAGDSTCWAVRNAVTADITLYILP